MGRSSARIVEILMDAERRMCAAERQSGFPGFFPECFSELKSLHDSAQQAVGQNQMVGSIHREFLHQQRTQTVGALLPTEKMRNRY